MCPSACGLFSCDTVMGKLQQRNGFLMHRGGGTRRRDFEGWVFFGVNHRVSELLLYPHQEHPLFFSSSLPSSGRQRFAHQEAAPCVISPSLVSPCVTFLQVPATEPSAPHTSRGQVPACPAEVEEQRLLLHWWSDVQSVSKQTLQDIQHPWSGQRPEHQEPWQSR